MAAKKADDRSLMTQGANLVKDAMKDIKSELQGEHVEMMRDYVKGIYRLRHSYEVEIKRMQDNIKEIDRVLDEAEKGDIESVKQIKVPAKYLSEKTVRLADLDWSEE